MLVALWKWNILIFFIREVPISNKTTKLANRLTVLTDSPTISNTYFPLDSTSSFNLFRGYRRMRQPTVHLDFTPSRAACYRGVSRIHSTLEKKSNALDPNTPTELGNFVPLALSVLRDPSLISYSHYSINTTTSSTAVIAPKRNVESLEDRLQVSF